MGEGGAHLQDTFPPDRTVVLNLSFLTGHAHLTDFNIATIIKDGERATALAGTKPYMGELAPPAHTPPPARRLASHPNLWLGGRVPSLKVQQQVTGQAA